MNLRQAGQREQVVQLILPPIRALLRQMPGITVHADPYTGPFEPYHHWMTHAQTWDLDSISAVVDAHGGPVLDMGCGSGRLALRLAKGGHDVTAVDTSTWAINRLRRVLASDPEIAARVHVLLGDFTDRDRVPMGRFRVAAIADLSINMFATPDAVGRLFAATKHALAEEGVLCLPVLNAESLSQVMSLRGMLAVPFPDDTGQQRLLWFVLGHEPDGPYYNRTLFIQDNNADDGTIRGHATAVRERLWTPETLRPLISAAGLQVSCAQPLQVPSALGPDVHVTLLTVRRATRKAR